MKKRSIVGTWLALLLILMLTYSPCGGIMMNAYATSFTESHPCTYPIMVNGVLDTTQHHTLYSPEDMHVLFKGDVLLHLVNGTDDYPSQVVHVKCPYPSLPDTWHWMVYEFDNPNAWPVTAYVDFALDNGERFTGNETFGAKETKYLRLMLNGSVSASQDVSNHLLTHTIVTTNMDPAAPPIPPAVVDYVYNPPADDSTGPTRTIDDLQGLSFAADPVERYSSLKFWALQPASKQVPTWIPNPGEDSHWGHIQWSGTPGYQWVQTGSFGAFSLSGGHYTNVSFPGEPYIVQGGLGQFQTTKPAAPAALVYNWTRTQWSTYVGLGNSILVPLSTFDGSTTPVTGTDTPWANYVTQNWPNASILDGNLLTGKSGSFFKSGNNGNIIKWSWQKVFVTGQGYSGQIDWQEFSPTTTSGMDIGANKTCSGVTADGQPHWTYTVPVTVQTVKEGYAPVTGSYDEVLSVSGSWTNGGNYNVTGCTIRQHALVCNPSSAPITFNLTQGIEDGDAYYSDYFTTPAPTQGTVTIQPGQTVDVTSDYSLPQSSYDYDGHFPNVPKDWVNNISNNYSISPDFAVGSARPIGDRYFAWTSSGVRSNIVAYDWGWWSGGGIKFYVNQSPGFDGGVLFYEPTMTPQEIALFSPSLSSTVQSKIQSVENNGYATWTISSSISYSNHNGHNSYVTAQ